MATRPDAELDLEEIKALLQQIAESIHECGDREKYTMNGFVISVGGYVKPLTAKAKSTVKKLAKYPSRWAKQLAKSHSRSTTSLKWKAPDAITKRAKQLSAE